MAGRAFWPYDFITSAFNDSLRAAGNKTTTLELIGWLVPMYHCISTIKNSHILLQCDNAATIFGFERGRSRADQWASTILTAIADICCEFNIYLHVEHLRRCSNQASNYADWLSRDDQKGKDLINMLDTPLFFGFPPSLLDWMDDPKDDFHLGSRLITDFRARLL